MQKYQASYPGCNCLVKVMYTPIGDARCCTPVYILAPEPTVGGGRPRCPCGLLLDGDTKPCCCCCCWLHDS
jgi:hypothetical protein